MKVLICGAGGQLGRALCDRVPDGVKVVAVTHAELDIVDTARVRSVVAAIRPDLVINAAAYAMVDRAESDPITAERCNSLGPYNLASVVRDVGSARLIHVSTDFVFDGRSSIPYPVDAPTAPLCVYGRTKLAGEQAVRKVLSERALTVRTAWMYDVRGNNFLRTMLRLMRERGSVRVVTDQVGTPTSAESLASVLWQFAFHPEISGIHHWTDAGVASWYDFAVAIAEEAQAAGLLDKRVDVQPIGTHEFPTLARRPAFSVLDKTATYGALEVTPVHWRQRLREAILQVAMLGSG